MIWHFGFFRLKYSISIVADKGLKKSLYTSARLKKGEVIYLETHFNRYGVLLLWLIPKFYFDGTQYFNFVTRLHRYELCFNGEKPRLIGSSSNASESETEKHQSGSHHSQNGDRCYVEHELRDVFRWSRCKKAMPESAMRSIGIPLPADQLEVLQLCWWLDLKLFIKKHKHNLHLAFATSAMMQVLQDNLEWEDVQWSQTSVWVAGKEHPLARVHFLSEN